VSEYQGPFKAGLIEPVVEPGHNVLLAAGADQGYFLYKVGYVEELGLSHPFVVNIGAIGAGVTAAVFNTTAILDMEFGQLGQFRAAVLDDIHVTVLQPQATARFGAMNVNATLNAFALGRDPCGHQSEFYIFEQRRVFLRAVNPTIVPLVQARIAFWGFKYVLIGADGATGAGGQLPPLKTFANLLDAEVWKRTPQGENYKVLPLGGWGR